MCSETENSKCEVRADMDRSAARLASQELALKFKARLDERPGRSFCAVLQMLRIFTRLTHTKFTTGLLELLGLPQFVPVEARKYVEAHGELAWRLSDYGAFGVPLFGYFVPGYAELDPVHQACARATVLSGQVSSGFSVRSGSRVVTEPGDDDEETKRLECADDIDLGHVGDTFAHRLFGLLCRVAHLVSPHATMESKLDSPWVPGDVLGHLLDYVESKGVSKFFVPAFCPTLEDVFSVAATHMFDHDFDEAIIDCRENYVATVFHRPLGTERGAEAVHQTFVRAMCLADEGTEDVGTTKLFPDDFDGACAKAAVLASSMYPPKQELKEAIKRACDEAVEAKDEPGEVPDREDLYPFGRLVLDELVKRRAEKFRISLSTIGHLTPIHVAMIVGQKSPLYSLKLLMDDDDDHEVKRVRLDN